jgi:hypothetical protein
MALEFYRDMIGEAIGCRRKPIIEIVPELRHSRIVTQLISRWKDWVAGHVKKHLIA